MVFSPPPPPPSFSLFLRHESLPSCYFQIRLNSNFEPSIQQSISFRASSFYLFPVLPFCSSAFISFLDSFFALFLSFGGSFVFLNFFLHSCLVAFLLTSRRRCQLIWTEEDNTNILYGRHDRAEQSSPGQGAMSLESPPFLANNARYAGRYLTAVRLCFPSLFLFLFFLSSLQISHDSSLLPSLYLYKPIQSVLNFFYLWARVELPYHLLIAETRLPAFISSTQCALV